MLKYMLVDYNIWTLLLAGWWDILVQGHSLHFFQDNVAAMLPANLKKC